MEKKINYYLGYLLAILSVIAAISLDQYTKLLLSLIHISEPTRH